jgi:tetratricopeptide (TPR) repeat protein
MTRIRWAQLAAVLLVVGAAVVVIMKVGSGGHFGATGSSVRTPSMGTEQPANPTADKEHELKALEVELKKKPKHVPILLRMAQLSRELGRPREAVAQLRQVVEAEPKNTDAYLELGRALYETNDLQGAIDQTKHVLVLDPRQVDALYNLGAIYANLNRPDLARDYWGRAVAAARDSDSGRRAEEGLQKLGAAK